VSLSLSSIPSPATARLAPDVVVCDSAAVLIPVAAFRVRDDFIVVVAFRVAGNDVPGMEEAGEVAEHAEEDVDEGVSGADARFDPYSDGRE